MSRGMTKRVTLGCLEIYPLSIASSITEVSPADKLFGCRELGLQFVYQYLHFPYHFNLILCSDYSLKPHNFQEFTKKQTLLQSLRLTLVEISSRISLYT